MKQMLRRLTVAVVLLTASSFAAAAVLPLQGRDINGHPVGATDPGAVFEYDPNLHITWLRDWNVNGKQNWATQVAWAAGLTYFGGGWRLPTALNQDGSGPCSGLNCTGSEMGYLWYTELGNTSSLSNTGPFLNMQSNGYWSGTEYAPAPTSAWVFNATSGNQGSGVKGNTLYAVAVRPGDVAPPPHAPVPTLSQWNLAALAVMLALAVGARRRR